MTKIETEVVARERKTKTLSVIKKRILLRRTKLKEAIDAIVAQLKNLGAIKISVFGSFITDNISPGSGLDILVIMPDSKDGKDWLKQIYSQIDRKVSCDFLSLMKKSSRRQKTTTFF